MNSSFRTASVALLFTFTTYIAAQPGAIDLSFNAGGAEYMEFNAQALAVLPDGRMLVVAYGLDENSVQHPPRLLRLNSDGSVDATFNSTQEMPWSRNILLRADGGFFVGGQDHLISMDENGNIDPGFNADLGTVSNVAGMALQPDGQLLVIAGYGAGSFKQEWNVRLTRLLTDGSQDPDFNTPIRSTDGLNSVCLDAAGHVVIGGEIVFHLNGQWVYRGICKLLPDGQFDPDFDADPQVCDGPGSDYVGSMLQLSDGSIISGVTTLRRLLPNGALDSSFAPLAATGGWDPWVRSIVEQEDGRIIIAGRFTSCSGTPCGRIARLNNDGSVDPSFIAAVGDNGGSTEVFDLWPQPDGKVLVSGLFTSMNGQATKRLVRINTCPGGENCESLSTGVANAGSINDRLDLFPVPYQDGPLTITSDRISSTQPVFVSIQGADGKIFMNERAAQNRGDGSAIVQNPTTLVSGVYVMRVRTQDWEASQRFVKQ